MRLIAVVLVSALVLPPAQSPESLLADTRLTVHTLVREDIFAGFMDDNLDRLTRAETNIEKLLELRPEQRANLLAWRSGAATYRAVKAHEADQAADFARHFDAAQRGFTEAASLKSDDGGVFAITGGTMAVFADRLPPQHRAAAWQQAWTSYSILWKQQGPGIADLPVHFKGELLAGLAQSAHRTGRAAETAQFLDKMLEHLGNTPYEPMAKQWKADPSVAATTTLTCKNCHNPGRLAAKMKSLDR